MEEDMVEMQKMPVEKSTSSPTFERSATKHWGRVPPVELSWSGLSCSVSVGSRKKKTTKMLLNNISGCAKPGQLLAIMGASGAGKTTLLNVLSGRTTPSMKITGNVMINGTPMNTKKFKQSAGFVTQEDVMHSFLKTKEVINFSAQMRLPKDMAQNEKKQRVRDTIAQLGLDKCKDTIIGNTMVRGISGGEKKRVNIGTELVKNPSVLFLDEPTSGLDAFTSLNLVLLLKQIATENGQTIVCTIHQPRSAIFNLFDSLLLLGQGETVYFGPASEAVDHFAAAGFPCPQYENPADYFLDITTPDSSSPEAREARVKQIQSLTEYYKQHEKPIDTQKNPTPLEKPPQRIGFLKQLYYLTKRATINNLRNYVAIVIRLVSALVMGTITGFTWLQLDNDSETVFNRNGFLFFSLLFVGFQELNNALTTFPEERAIFLQERAAGFYGVLPYFLSKVVADTPIRMSMPIIFSSIAYWMVGLEADPSAYFAYLGAQWMLGWTTSMMGLTLSAVNKTVQAAAAMSTVLMVLMMLFAGFFITNSAIPDYFIWFHYISPVKYGYTIMVNSQYEDLKNISCPRPPEPCQFPNGKAVLDYLEIDVPTYAAFLVLFGEVLLLHVLTYLALRFLNKRK